jgi:NADH:ubiquinone oxidoreductase subunit 5 (subunit L)/multisubunit Na+/H+ antiporter MnhA subunit
MEFAIILFPLLSFFIISLYKTKIGFRGAKVLILITQGVALLLALKTLIIQIKKPQIITYELGTFISIDFFKVDLGFTFDSITIISMCVINIIAALVLMYSFEYMKAEVRKTQFLAHLCLFVFFMLVLVSSANLIVLYIGWEGVGLCSYLLINHWHSRLQANKAAIKAMVMNRIGDCFLILAFISCWALFGTFDLYTIFTLVPGVLKCSFNFLNFEFHSITLIGFFLFMAAVGKSAQIGLHTWLPDAMEGPTPVSALLHAATMVTAGVILLIRFSPLLEFTFQSLHSLMLIIGSLTAFFWR